MTGTTNVNKKTLPPNVFDLQHDDFYTFVEIHVGVLQAKILQFQLISDATTFIECHDPTEILQYNSEKLIDLKQKTCLITNKGACIILPGIVASFKMLKKCLLKKIEEDNKRNRNNIVNSSAPVAASVTNRAKSIDDHRNHITTIISQWFRTHRDEMNLKQDALLEENKDYHIEFKNVNNSNESAAVICGCGTKATLSRVNNTGYYQVCIYVRCRQCEFQVKFSFLLFFTIFDRLSAADHENLVFLPCEMLFPL